ncbi:MAG: AAA family ATPase [Patescibacteria group bacterium]
MIGHEAIQKAFEKLVRERALGHAYLFFGDAQIGKASFAECIASLIERSIFEKSSVQLLDATTFIQNEKGNIGIDEVRDIKRFLWQTPFVSTKRIVIIDGAEALTPEAQGAMLKIVEEPPVHGLIIFVTHDPSAILPKLVSRCAKIYFSRLSAERIEEYLVREQKIPVARAHIIAIKSHGRIGRALQLLNKDSAPSENVSDKIAYRILALWEDGVLKNSAKLAWLLERESLVARYNVNPNIQKKAVEYIAGRSYN